MVLLQSLLPGVCAATAAAAAAAGSTGGGGYRRCYICGRSSSSSSSSSSSNSSSSVLTRWWFGLPQQQQQLQRQQQQQLGRCSKHDLQRSLKKAVDTLRLMDAEEAAARGQPPPSTDYDVLEDRWAVFLNSVCQHGKMSTANFIDAYSDGDVTLHAMLESVGHAEKFVFLESYIFDSSPPAAAMKEALKAAAARGCLVILLVDGIGSLELAPSWMAELLKAGVHVVIFNPPLPAAFYSAAAGAAATAAPAATAAAAGSLHAARVGPLSFRDHRKALVVDGEEAFFGSFNVEKESTSLVTGGTGRYQDLHARVKGPAARDVGLVFVHSLQAAQAEALAVEAERQLLQASMSIHLASAYFLPPAFLLRPLLQQIRSKQVELLLLLSGESDVWCDVPATTYVAHKLVAVRERRRPLQDWLLLQRQEAALQQRQQQQEQEQQQQQQQQQEEASAAKAAEGKPLLRLLRQLGRMQSACPLKAELRIHFTTRKHYHGKNLVADRLWTSIGSFNFDRFSSRRNLEVCVGIVDARLASQLANLQERQAAEAPAFTAKTWKDFSAFKKAVCLFAYHLLKFTGKSLFEQLAGATEEEVLRLSLKHQKTQEAALPALAAAAVCC
ncbi:hypothetical protein Efla_005210 [Eimeria flavescens]